MTWIVVAVLTGCSASPPPMTPAAASPKLKYSCMILSHLPESDMSSGVGSVP